MNRRFATICSFGLVVALAVGVFGAATASASNAAAAPVQEIAPAPSNIEKIAPLDFDLPAVGQKSGMATKIIQDRLNQLGFWNTATGKYDWSTSQAVMAFQKYIGSKRSGSVDRDTATWLKLFNERAHASANYGTLVEVDKARQLLFIVVDGTTKWVFNTSTGSGKPYEATNKKDPTKIETGDAQTPNGLYRVERQRPDGWWEGDLGKIYRPKYFVGGIAFHGMTSVPAYPASHGCVRVSIDAMNWVWDTGIIPKGMAVWVYS